jgi:hypothetical protein
MSSVYHIKINCQALTTPNEAWRGYVPSYLL